MTLKAHHVLMKPAYIVLVELHRHPIVIQVFHKFVASAKQEMEEGPPFVYCRPHHSHDDVMLLGITEKAALCDL